MRQFKSLVKKVSIPPEKKTKQKDYLVKGVLPIIDQGQQLIGGYSNDSNRKLSCKLPVVVFGDHTRAVKYVDFPFGSGADGIKVLEPVEELFPKFLYYATQYLVLRLEDRGYARHYQYIEKKELEVPSVPEQKRIVARIEELFSELDNGVETLQKTKQQLIKYRRAVIKFELEKEISNAVWNDTCILEVCDCLDNKRKPVKQDKRSSGEGKYPYYGANGQTGTIDDYLFGEELVLVVEDETFVGRIKPFSYVISGKTWVNNHAHVLRGKAGKMDNHYLNYLLSYYPFLPMTTGTTGRKKLTKAALVSAPIHICDYEHQREVVKQIDAKLSVCDELEKTVNNALLQAEAMRQSILKQAFEGGL